VPSGKTTYYDPQSGTHKTRPKTTAKDEADAAVGERLNDDLAAASRARKKKQAEAGASSQSPAEEADLAEMTPLAAAAERARRKRLKAAGDTLAAIPPPK